MITLLCASRNYAKKQKTARCGKLHETMLTGADPKRPGGVTKATRHPYVFAAAPNA
jgi:hypothetical protein